MKQKNKTENMKVLSEEDIVVFGGFGRRVLKNDFQDTGWEECFFEDTTINKNKKTILYFGGNKTVEPGHANFGCKFVEGLVGKSQENNFDLFGFYYTHKKTTTTVLDENGKKQELTKNSTGGFSEFDLAKVYNSFLKPLLCDENGKAFSEKQIEKNLSNLRIFAYCKGAEEAENLLFNADQFLRFSFDEQTSKRLLENVFVLSFAPWSPTSSEPRFGTHVAFKSLRDAKTKQPWRASKEGWGYQKDEPFLGVAETDFNKNKNVLEVFSNSFVSIENLLEKQPYDPHSIADFLKVGGVIDRKALPNYTAPSKAEKEKQKQWQKQNPNKVFVEKRPQGYSRQQAVADLMSSALAHALVFDRVNLNEVKGILDRQISHDNQVFYEQNQKQIFEEKMKKDERKIELQKKDESFVKA